MEMLRRAQLKICGIIKNTELRKKHLDGDRKKINPCNKCEKHFVKSRNYWKWQSFKKNSKNFKKKY